jgi:hypothetical protein
VENDLHWSFDVAMREDDCRVRETQARENLAVLRHHVAMSRLKNDSTKLGIKNKLSRRVGTNDTWRSSSLSGHRPRVRTFHVVIPIFVAVDAIALPKTGLSWQPCRFTAPAQVP